MPKLITQRIETAFIDEQTCRAAVTLQWLLERKEDIAQHPITAHNNIEVLICGEQGFGRIAADLQAARETIEIACWGFDPAMELTRGGSGHWPRGAMLGELLERKAKQGVKVRLLAWYDALGSIKQNNLIGYSEVMPKTRGEQAVMVGAIAGGLPVNGYQPMYARAASAAVQDDRHDYCVLWWRRAIAGEVANLEIRLRDGNDAKVQASLAGTDVDPQDRPSDTAGSALGMAHERRLIGSYATHHQKTVLIDYERDGGREAVGYVMGLNSLTDYWDSQTHHFNDPRREVDWARQSKLGAALGTKRAVARDPYQDYAARLRGQALQQVEANFSSAWKRARPGRRPLPALARSVPLRLAVRPGPGRRIQIVRTQPEEGDRTIQRAYWQATRSARSYIYIENQYFYYEAWARHLKAMRREFMTGLQREGVAKSDAKVLHAFVVIPWPEDDGMVPRTYDTVKSLGEAGSMPYQDKAVTGESRRSAAQQADYDRQVQAWRKSGGNYRTHPLPPPQRNAIYESAAQVQAPAKNAEGELGEAVPDVAGRPMKFEGLGLKVLLARMVSFNDAGHDGYVAGLPPQHNYRQVYIHSKLAIADDCWFTLGSANLNVRSMAADSEINVNVENGDVATDLRRRVWGLMTGGEHDGGGGMPKEISKTFDDWKKLMDRNKALMPISERIHKFLIPFEDERFVEFRHG